VLACCLCRAEFRVWHKGEHTFYIMFEKARQRGMTITCSIDHTALVSGKRLAACL
jgi:tRNA (Uracil-5-)-methyltransferase